MSVIDATRLLRLYAARRGAELDRQDPAEAQRRQLLRLVRAARGTAFGRDHGFDRIRSVADFQRQVPLRRYEAMWAEYWEPAFPTLRDVSWPGLIPYFAATSGTTSGRTKYIPVSRPMVQANKGAVLDLLTHHLRNRPGSHVLGGKSLMLGSTGGLSERAPGVRCGELSGIAANEVPFWVRPYYFPPRNLSLPSDWDENVEALGRLSLGEDIRIIGGTASWLLLFIERTARLCAEQGRPLVDLYPNLELVVHGGVDFAPYRTQFERLLDGSHAELREVYPASEGFVAIGDRGTGEGLRLITDRGAFFEFVPVAELDAVRPPRHWLADVEVGVNYAVVLSTCAGAWGYVLGDTVRFTERNPPRLVMTGRTAYTLSAFGEHLIGQEIEAAVAAAAKCIGSPVLDYSVGAAFPDQPAQRGGHVYVVEFTRGPPDAADLARFAEEVDARLRAANRDYSDFRAGSFGIAPPRVEPAPRGTFAAWMKARGKLGGQHKVPRIINDQQVLASLRDLASRRRAGVG